MKGPRFGQPSIGAVAGAVVGSIGGLFTLGLVRAIAERDITLILGTPVLAFVSWLVSLPAGWLVGGQIGPRMGLRFRSGRAEIIGGACGGLIPIVLIALWGWYMERR